MNPQLKNYVKRFAMLIFGLMIASYGATMTLESNLGVSPWDVFAQGMALKLTEVTGTQFYLGQMIRSIGWVVLILAIVLKEKIGFGTIIDIAIVGYFIDFYMA